MKKSAAQQFTELEVQMKYVLTMPDYTRKELLHRIEKMKPSVEQVEYEAQEYRLDLTATGTGLG